MAAAARLPRGSGVLARGASAAVRARLADLARRRGMVLLVAGDGRAALAAGAGLHVPDRRRASGLLPFLLARRAGAPGAVLTIAAHGGAASAARRLGVPAVALGGVSAATMARVPRQAAGFAAIDGLAPQAVAGPPHCLR